MFPDFLAYLLDPDQLISDSHQVEAVLPQFYQAQRGPFQSHVLGVHPATIIVQTSLQIKLKSDNTKKHIPQLPNRRFSAKLVLGNPSCSGILGKLRTLCTRNESYVLFFTHN